MASLQSIEELIVPAGDAAWELAVDEAILEAAEEGEGCELLRVWELRDLSVIVGRGSKLHQEVRVDKCDEDGVPILRRCSGGAAIVAGPGCLMYSLVLSLEERPELRKLDVTHEYVMGGLARAVSPHLDGVAMKGTCDLTWNNKKFSGNSLRVTRNWVLYHGTLLYAGELGNLTKYLTMPPRRPGYREDRDHSAFVTTIPLSREQLVCGLKAAFKVEGVREDFPKSRAQRLLGSRYNQDSWHRRHP